MKLIQWACIIAVLLSCAGVSATDYFVNAARPDDSGNGLTPATAKKTIAAAIAIAANGDRILVSAGSYPGAFNVNKTLTLLGAQAGVDARTRAAAAPESVLQATASSAATVTISASGCTLDGFKVVGDPNGVLTSVLGIEMFPSISGTQVLNNIITQNTIGAYPAGNGLTQTVVKFNLFTNNNLPGGASGNAMYTDFGLNNALISSNTITNQSNGGVLITGVLPNNTNSNLTIQNNDISSTAVAVLLVFTSTSTIDDNRMTNCSEGVQLRGADTEIAVTNNTVTDSTLWPIVCFTRSDVGIDNRDVSITGNTVNQNVGVFQPLPGGFTTRAAIDVRNVLGHATISQNVVNLTGTLPAAAPRVPGIEIQGATTGSVSINSNELRGGSIDPTGSTTPGSGVRIDADISSNSTVDVKNNRITGFTYGVDSFVANTDNSIHVNYNDLTGSPAINNEGSGVLDGEYNWFGATLGPAAPTNPAGTGAAVSANVSFSPWLASGADQKPLDTSSQAAFLASVGLQTSGFPLGSLGPGILSAAAAAPNPANVSQNVQFTAAGADSLNRTITITWDFGDGATAPGATVSHAYAAAGTYAATATLTTPDGGVSRTSVTVSVVTPTVGGGGTPTPTPLPFTVKRKSLHASIPSRPGDSITLTGGFNLPTGTTALNGTFALSISNLNGTFLVNANGAAKLAKSAGTLSIHVKRKKRIIQGSAATFTVKLKGDVAGALTAAGLPTGKSGSAILNVQFTYLNALYGEALTFAVKGARSGSNGK